MKPIVVAVAATAFVFLVAPVVLFSLFDRPPDQVTYFAVTAGLAVAVAKRLGVAFGSPRALLDVKILARALAGGLAVQFLAPLAVLPLLFAFGDAVASPLTGTRPDAIAALAFGPVAEEFVFRGVWMDALSTWVRRGPWLWVLVGGLFAIAHLEFMPVPLLLHFAMGMYLSFVRERWGNLWLCAAVHAFANLVAYGARLLP